MIRPFVKTFIEQFITEIEDHNWSRIVDRWYDYALFHSLEYEDAMFDQFVAIMKHVVGVDFLEESEKDRRDIINFHLSELIQDHLSSHRSNKYKKNIYTDQLVSSLGFTVGELEEICDTVVEKLGLSYDDKYYYLGDES